MADIQHYTYRVSWSADDSEFVATCVEFPSLSWLAEDQGEALAGLIALAREVVEDLVATGGAAPEPSYERRYSGR